MESIARKSFIKQNISPCLRYKSQAIFFKFSAGGNILALQESSLSCQDASDFVPTGGGG